ncbi:jg2256 [Pararge aegeria aegeria]|uniref:Jg2256 protein n=1 Tax=Pararge aegeria aegeria TaxID=348720 RepID=A0A8S4R1T7_9NEOP|nr:jg2256 [Pararge aegeria aegeria]
MPILFSAVAFQKTVLNKYATCDGNFAEIVEEVLKKITKRNHKMTYLHGKYLFHYVIESEYLYFCVTDKLCQRSRAFLFLNEIKRRFENNKVDFTCTLAEQMYCYNEDSSKIIIRNGELDEVNKIGVDSSESIIGEKLLVVSNENHPCYSTLSYCKARPEKVVISFKESKRNIFVVASLMIIAISLMFVFSPLSIAFLNCNETDNQLAVRLQSGRVHNTVVVSINGLAFENRFIKSDRLRVT